MRKIVLIFITLMITIFLLICYMVYKDNNYLNKIKKDIIKTTDIIDVTYLNKYGNYYIVKDNEYLYLMDDEYNILLQKDLILVHENTNNYDIIYRDENFMYMHDYKEKHKLIYEYYNIGTYELIDTVSLGG